MEFSKVFISSVMNINLEDLSSERETARAMIESFPFLKAWAFENAPASAEPLDDSYLRPIRDCDLFVLILGATITDPVANEYFTAVEGRKRILLFAKNVHGRSPEANFILTGADVKYKTFDSCSDLAAQLKIAIENTIVLALRQPPVVGAPQSVFLALKKLKAASSVVRIRPSIPRTREQDEFHVREVTVGSVEIEKLSCDNIIDLPVQCVQSVYPASNTQPAILNLNGRLQWITLIQRWRFFPEAPPLEDYFGWSKPSNSTRDARAALLIREFQHSGRELNWKRLDALDATQAAWELVYDEDGRYLRINERGSGLALALKS